MTKMSNWILFICSWGTENNQTGPKYIASVVDNENECLNKGSICQVCDKRFR